MSTDENLVARNQETAEANGLAAAHTRAERTEPPPPPTTPYRCPPPSRPLPYLAAALPVLVRPPACPSRTGTRRRFSLFRDRMPIEIHNYAKNTRRLLYPLPGGTHVWSHTTTETACCCSAWLGFRGSFFQPDRFKSANKDRQAGSW